MPRPNNVPDLLDMAAHRIERYGWTQEDYFDFDIILPPDTFRMPTVVLTKCRVCAAGAINYAGGAELDDPYLVGLRYSAAMALVEHLGLPLDEDAQMGAEVNVIGRWNDEDGRTAEEVVTALRECAAAERSWVDA